jgi:hypothetical protein
MLSPQGCTLRAPIELQAIQTACVAILLLATCQRTDKHLGKGRSPSRD